MYQCALQTRHGRFHLDDYLLMPAIGVAQTRDGLGAIVEEDTEIQDTSGLVEQVREQYGNNVADAVKKAVQARDELASYYNNHFVPSGKQARLEKFLNSKGYSLDDPRRIQGEYGILPDGTGAYSSPSIDDDSQSMDTIGFPYGAMRIAGFSDEQDREYKITHEQLHRALHQNTPGYESEEDYFVKEGDVEGDLAEYFGMRAETAETSAEREHYAGMAAFAQKSAAELKQRKEVIEQYSKGKAKN